MRQNISKQMEQYDHKKIEKKWQKIWAKKKIYKTESASKKEKFYILDMFPYPSGEGLHVGHPKGYIATDVISRMYRMKGKNVLHPMGFDAFGLPAENYAIKMKINPEIAVKKNVERYKEQLEILGFDYDWSREINTTDPSFYKWTQWIFLRLLEKGLAYESFEPINWCPSCKTGLANEDVEDGKCERCGSVVEKKPMRQWVLRITDYADRMLEDLKLLDWPESIKESQRNWIGKSTGTLIKFEIRSTKSETRPNVPSRYGQANSKSKILNEENGEIEVFTTRADTLFGVTYLVVAPEHPLVAKLLAENHELGIMNYEEIKKYVNSVKNKTEIDRTGAGKEKTGVEIMGIKAINPANNEEIPIWVADYVLADYGTGAVMAVPAHDERDFAFAQKYKLPIEVVVREHAETYILFVTRGIVSDWKEKIGAYKWKMREDWAVEIYMNDDEIDNFLPIAQSLLKDGPYYASTHGNTRFIIYRDRVFNIYIGGENEKAKIHGRSIKVPENELDWSEAVISIGTLCSSGRFDGMKSEEAKKEITKFVGGKMVTKYKLKDWVFSRQRYWGEPIPVIHCTDCGVVPVPEKDLPIKLPKVKSYEPTGTGESPLADISKWVNVKCPKCKGKAKRETNTMPQWAGSSWYYIAYILGENLKLKIPISKQILNPNFQKEIKKWLPVDFYVGGAEHATRHLIYARFWHKFLMDIGVVSTPEPFKKLQSVGLIMAEDGRKMSKRFGNVVNPDSIVETVGADTLRLYEMFMGPFDQAIAWNMQSIAGSRRFLERVWSLGDGIMNYELRIKNGETERKNPDIEILLNQTIKKVGEDIGNMKFNTAISSLMVLLNAFEKEKNVCRDDYEIFLRLLAPFSPHITDEIWAGLGKKESIHISTWPDYDKQRLVSSKSIVVVQVNGKVRGQFEIDGITSDEKLRNMALELPEIKKWTQNLAIKKVIVVKGKLVSIVV